MPATCPWNLKTDLFGKLFPLVIYETHIRQLMVKIIILKYAETKQKGDFLNQKKKYCLIYSVALSKYDDLLHFHSFDSGVCKYVSFDSTSSCLLNVFLPLIMSSLLRLIQQLTQCSIRRYNIISQREICKYVMNIHQQQNCYTAAYIKSYMFFVKRYLLEIRNLKCFMIAYDCHNFLLKDVEITL